MTGKTCPSFDPALPQARAVGTGGIDPERRTLQLIVVGPGDTGHRAVGPCHQNGCGNWAAGRCGVADAIVDAFASAPPTDAEPRWLVEDCEIRDTCRWYAQHGNEACAVCAYVIEPEFYADSAAAD